MRLHKDELIWTKMTEDRWTERQKNEMKKKTEIESEGMAKGQNDRMTESPCQEAWLID